MRPYILSLIPRGLYQAAGTLILTAVSLTDTAYMPAADTSFLLSVFYSFDCRKMSKNDGDGRTTGGGATGVALPGRLPAPTGGEYRARTDDLLHAMQAL